MLPPSRTWEDVNFRKEVYKIITSDSRFDGMASYLSSVHMCWSYTTANSVSGYGFMFFNPDWWDLLPEETRKTVIFHHGLALLCRHRQRGEGLQPIVFAQASQNVINLVASDEGFTADGWNWTCDHIFTGSSVENVYTLLMEQEDYTAPEDLLASILPDEMLEDMIESVLDEDGKPIDLEDAKAEDEINVVRTVENGPGYGIGFVGGSAGLDLNIGHQEEIIVGATYEEILEPYTDTGEPQMTRTYRRPSRRSAGSDFILPGRMKIKGHRPDRIKHLYLLLDVSGSIGQEQARQFNYSAQTIKSTLDPEMMTVMFFDTRIVKEVSFKDTEKYTPLKVRAGGGTNLNPPYKRIAEINPELVMIFTDMQVGIPDQPEWDTIWMVPDKQCPIPKDLYGQVYLIPPREKV